jgi:hypothetical protein
MGCTSFVVNNFGIVGLGYNQTVDSNTFYKYETSTFSWKKVPIDSLIIARRGSVGFTIGQSGYFYTGETDSGLLSDLWSYNPNFSSIKDAYSVNLSKIFLKPTCGKFELISFKQDYTRILTIFSEQGVHKYSQLIRGCLENIDISYFDPGIYFAITKDIEDSTIIKIEKK